MSIDWRNTGDGYVAGFEWDGSRVTRALYEPGARAVLEHNKVMRSHEHLQKDASFGRLALSMSEIDRMTIARLFPEINSPDADIRSKAWKRFIASPLSAPYKVRERI